MSRRIRIADFAWKRVAFCGPRFVNPLDEPLVGSLVTQVVQARPARIVLGDSGCEVLILRSILKMMQVRAVHPLLSVTAVVTSALGQNPDLATLVAAARVPTTNNGHFEVFQLSLDPGRAESYVTRDMVKLGRVGWDCMRSVVLAFTPAGGWRNAKVMPPLIARAREQGMTIIEVALPNTTGRPLPRC